MKKNSGYLVETKSGKKGRTYHEKGLINGKVAVYIEGGEMPVLCEMRSLKIVGYAD